MKLTADSGSTKTAWKVTDDSGTAVYSFITSGLNPALMGMERFAQLVRDELLPHITHYKITDIAFYGAGCTAQMIPQVEEFFKTLLPEVRAVTIGSDMLGACRALLGKSEGIAAILGTGANSCLYDGQRIIQNTPALGYILGDEGGGAVMGKQFLNALFKGRLPQKVREDFDAEYGYTQADIINHVYRQPEANRFLASFSPFLHAHKDMPEVRAIIVSNFQAFLKNNITPYNRKDLAVHCVGSMAYYFSDELREAAEKEHFTIGTIIKAPIDVM